MAPDGRFLYGLYAGTPEGHYVAPFDTASNREPWAPVHVEADPQTAVVSPDGLRMYIVHRHALLSVIKAPGPSLSR